MRAAVDIEYGLEEILPHRGGMMLLEAILEAGDNYARTSALIGESSPMLGEDGADPLIMVELAAQTAGVCNGLEILRTEGKDGDNRGWLVGIKRAQFFIDAVPLGSRVEIRSENSHKYENLREISSIVRLDGRVIGELTLQLFKA